MQKTDRRTTILALLTGAVAGFALLAARRGVPGMKRLATKMGGVPQRRAATKAPTYGYNEVNLS